MIVFIAGISIGLFIAFLLLTKKHKSTSDKILLVWMFIMVFHLSAFYLVHTELVYNFILLWDVSIPLPLFHGIFLYLYVGSLTNQLPKNKKWLVLHFLPLILTYAYLLDFMLLPASEKIEVYRNEGAGYEIFNAILLAATMSSGVVYVVWSSILLRRHKRRILDQFSDVEKINLRWLQFLIWGIGGIWAIVIFTQESLAIFGAVTVFIILIGYFGVRQVGIFSTVQLEELEEPEAPTATPREKYSKSSLTKESSSKLHQQLIQLMHEEAIYQQQSLSIGELASKLDVHPNYISQIINEIEGKNFYDFVNDYRIDAFKRLVTKPENQHLTLLSIAYECGFNSKSSFNRYFKKATGQTPSQYFNSMVK